VTTCAEAVRRRASTVVHRTACAQQPRPRPRGDSRRGGAVRPEREETRLRATGSSEASDLFGIAFPGHPNLHRILCHDAFVGHALRKDYAPGQRWFFAEEDLRMPEWSKHTDERVDHFETQTISIGPSHPATHGIIHLVARLDGDRIIRAETMIGYRTAASRRWRRRTTVTRSFRTPTGSTTSPP
jgi:hypothetical protein